LAIADLFPAIPVSSFRATSASPLVTLPMHNDVDTEYAYFPFDDKIASGGDDEPTISLSTARGPSTISLPTSDVASPPTLHSMLFTGDALTNPHSYLNSLVATLQRHSEVERASRDADAARPRVTLDARLPVPPFDYDAAFAPPPVTTVTPGGNGNGVGRPRPPPNRTSSIIVTQQSGAVSAVRQAGIDLDERAVTDYSDVLFTMQPRVVSRAATTKRYKQLRAC
jgi:hypothetical protein